MKRKADKRGKLIQTGQKLIHRQGYHLTTLADIAEHSNITVGNIYHYFKTKEQLAQAIIDERTERFKALTKEWEGEPSLEKWRNFMAHRLAQQKGKNDRPTFDVNILTLERRRFTWPEPGLQHDQGPWKEEPVSRPGALPEELVYLADLKKHFSRLCL